LTAFAPALIARAKPCKVNARKPPMPRPASPSRLALSLVLSLLPLAPGWAEDARHSSRRGDNRAQPGRPALEERSQADADNLQRQLPDKQQQTLQAGQEASSRSGCRPTLPRPKAWSSWCPATARMPIGPWPSARCGCAARRWLADPQPDPARSRTAWPPRRAGRSRLRPAPAADAAARKHQGRRRHADAGNPRRQPGGEPHDSSEAPPAPDGDRAARPCRAHLARIQAGVGFALQPNGRRHPPRPRHRSLLGAATSPSASRRNPQAAAGRRGNAPGFRRPWKAMVPRLQLAWRLLLQGSPR
jgi:hypothetical protein